MKKIIALVAFSAILIGADGVFAQASSTASNATANAKVVRPINIVWKQALEYGVLVPGPTSGYASIRVNGLGDNAVTSGAPVPVTPFMEGGASRVETAEVERPATFIVTGEANYAFGIYVPPTPVYAVIIMPLNPDPPGIPTPVLELDQFHTNLVANFAGYQWVAGAPDNTGTGNGGSSFLSPVGVKYFAVGARVKIDPTDASSYQGLFTGVFSVTAFYN